ncbi:RING finger domain-containing protein [Patellaria atrata CBS 101060]|uniref:RING finger domain-containing protein n=1 Tax=Patellaria atrata CBS 101060 TaxID=1346257 RepID=A0A9P4SD89_9PEZI|nr:RING finger domain-containing protein [Patellaria atrata CBS 101060]
MASSGFEARPGWQWPEDLADLGVDTDTNARNTYHQHPSDGSPPNGQESSSNRRSQSPRPSKHYKPRTCRICLDIVQPTWNAPSEHLPGFMQREPNVTYESEQGRLISPCKCKGSSKYVHEGCLQQWRHADPSYGARHYWKCPTCGFKYRLERMNWGKFIGSTGAQILLTVLIFMVAIFILGFIADPIINLYLDPYGSIVPFIEPKYKNIPDPEPSTWSEHAVKGLASLGLLGFLKVFLAGPWWHFRIGGGGGRRRATTGRDRLADVSWFVIMVGVMTFLWTLWKGVRAWSRMSLKKAGERVVDIQGDGDDDDDEDENAVPSGVPSG